MLGRSLSKLLTGQGVRHTIGSRNNTMGIPNWVKMDLLNNEGVKEALHGKEIIFHLATDYKKDRAVTQNLLQAIDRNAKNVHLLYISIVGIDKVPYDYYKQKLLSEYTIKESGVPYTILRATQFHEFIDYKISTFLKYPIGLLPKKIISQPIQKEVVATELYKLSTGKASDNTVEIGGPEALTLEQMAKDWLKHTGKKRWMLNLPIWGHLGTAFRNGSLTTLNSKAESMSWGEWLKQKYKNA